MLTWSYGGAPLTFRGTDSNALEEVLGREEYGFLRSWLAAKRSPRIIDAGCHIGTFAIWVFGVNPAALILGVEADRQTYHLALRNLEERPAASRNWSILNRAAGARDGDILRFCVDGPSMSHRISPSGTQDARSISLETLLRRLSPGDEPVDLVKVDIEGSEEAFLCERPESLARVERLVVELHPGSCDMRRVRECLAGRFDSIVEVQGRCSDKPLLDCRRRA